MQNEDFFHEPILYNIREHWIVLMKPIMAFFMATALLSLIGLWVYHSPLESNVIDLILLFVYFIFLAVFHFTFVYFFKWANSSLYIGENHVISFAFLPYAYNNVTFIKISQMHEIEEQQNGIIANVLDYGLVNINLSATQQPISLKYVSKPSKVVSIIEAIKERHSGEDFLPSEDADKKIS